jgi:hypothetical protein
VKRKIRITNDGTGPLGTNINDVDTGFCLTGHVRAFTYELRANEMPIAKLEFVGPQIDIIAELDEQDSESVRKLIYEMDSL